MLKIPTVAATNKIAKAFLADMESYTYIDESTQVIHPIVCCICDGMPTCPQWSKWITISMLKQFCKTCQFLRSKLAEEKIYCSALLDQYKVNHKHLAEYILSPKTLINNKGEVLICKECHQFLETMMDKQSRARMPPPKAIASGRLVGDAPYQLKRLCFTELALVSGAKIDCQSYVFFGGCHQQIRGWHTIFKNRPAANASNLQQLATSGLKGEIVVVLCGPFTTTQKALVMKKVHVNPVWVIEAFEWLKQNNYLHYDMEIPSVDEIPVPIIVDENM